MKERSEPARQVACKLFFGRPVLGSINAAGSRLGERTIKARILRSTVVLLSRPAATTDVVLRPLASRAGFVADRDCNRVLGPAEPLRTSAEGGGSRSVAAGGTEKVSDRFVPMSPTTTAARMAFAIRLRQRRSTANRRRDQARDFAARGFCTSSRSRTGCGSRRWPLLGDAMGSGARGCTGTGSSARWARARSGSTSTSSGLMRSRLAPSCSEGHRVADDFAIRTTSPSTRMGQA